MPRKNAQKVGVTGCLLVIANLSVAGSSSQATGPDDVQMTSERLGMSGGGREIKIVRVHKGAEGAQRPAWLVVAGIDPRHGGSAAVAAALPAELAKNGAGALEHGDVYVLSMLNPDGIAGNASGGGGHETARNRAALGKLDADRDGRFNEDPPVDLDGDGRILWMRVKNPAAGSGLTAEYVSEESDPRVLRKADKGKGERAVYALLPECRDADGDGLYGEDGFDGVELDRNFPYHWPEFRDEAGRVPLSEVETRGVVEWLEGHPNVVGVVVYAPADNLVHVPPGGKMDETGEAPATNHVLDADRGVYERVGEKFREITKQKDAPARDNEGTLQGWAYAQLGVWSFTTPVWVRPDQIKVEEKKEEKKEEPKAEKKEEVKPEEKPEVKGDVPKVESKATVEEKAKGEEKPKGEKTSEPPTEKPGPKKIDSEEGKWMVYSDGLVAAGKPGGFVEWKPFRHPRLGDVEIGGFLPGFRTDIPVSEVGRLAEEQARFIADLLERTARLVARPASVERLGEGVWRVSVLAVNEGSLPTRTAMGVKVHRLAPTRWTIGVERTRILAGDRATRADAVAGGEGERVKIVLESPECGVQEVEVVLGGLEKKEGRP